MKILEKDQNSVDPYILPMLMFKNGIKHFPFYFPDVKVRSILFPNSMNKASLPRAESGWQNASGRAGFRLRA